MYLCVSWTYVNELSEVLLSDTGVIVEEGSPVSSQVLVITALFGSLQPAEHQGAHHQVQHDPRKEGHEGGATHPPLCPPPPSWGRGIGKGACRERG